MAVEALTLHMAGMIEDGAALPEPSTLDQLAGDPAMQGAVAFLVSAEAPEKTVRVNITARESQIEAIDKLARKAGMTRSAYMVQSAVSDYGQRSMDNVRRLLSIFDKAVGTAYPGGSVSNPTALVWTVKGPSDSGSFDIELDWVAIAEFNSGRLSEVEIQSRFMSEVERTLKRAS
jgi:hypothetical protein